MLFVFGLIVLVEHSTSSEACAGRIVDTNPKLNAIWTGLRWQRIVHFITGTSNRPMNGIVKRKNIIDEGVICIRLHLHLPAAVLISGQHART